MGWNVCRFLIIESFPYGIIGTLGVDLQKILVRSCYEELYEIVTAAMLEPGEEISDGVIAMPRFLFRGVSGIGKSVFMIYFLCRYSTDDRFTDRRFAAEFLKGKISYYRPKGNDGKYYFSPEITPDILRDILLVVDMDEATLPTIYAKYTFDAVSLQIIKRNNIFS